MTQSRRRGESACAEDTARPSRELAHPADGSSAAIEANDLARELAGAFGRMVKSYREHFQLSPEEARDRAEENPVEALDRMLSAPPDQVSWFDLDSLSRRDPGEALRRWQEVVQAARDEVRSGHRASRTIEGFDAAICWHRARFLGLRAELSDAWRPRNQLEQQLIDQMAQFQTRMEYWQEILTTYTMLSSGGTGRGARDRRPHELPRLSDAEAVDQAADMVERWQRLFLRTLAALQSQRRPSRTGIALRAGQVNIAPQQVNLVGGDV
jgi:hypothetical protein